jgi:hypothetical protein
VPLHQDLAREQKRLRLKPAATARDLDLDLRQPTDLARSHLLHRLRLLDVPWGEYLPAPSRQRGTFHERWRLLWRPELAVRLVEASRWGNTVAGAAAAKARALAREAEGLPGLADLLDVVLLAELPAAAEAITARVQAEAAVAADLGHLMDALPPLANIARYGSVRHQAAGQLAGVVAGLMARVCIGLPGACAALNDEAAAAMEARLAAVHAAVLRLDESAQRAAWLATLVRLADQRGLHGLLAGRCCRLLHDQGALEPGEVARRLRLALSLAVEPAQAAAWVEGLLGAFSTAERRQMGERARRGRADVAAARAVPDLALAQSEAVLPLVAQLLGLSLES